MNNATLAKYLREFFAWRLDTYEVNTDALGDDLAAELIRRNYCTDTPPGFYYEKALCCPINKRKEAECKAAKCACYKFCQLLRREGYLS